MSRQDASIVSSKDFENSPIGWQKRWVRELQAARKASRKWKENAKRITKIFLDERADAMDNVESSRLNVFSANIITMRAMLFGQTPHCEVARRYEDANDDVARVAAEMMERLLNADIGDQFSYSLGMALDDRLLVGAGIARVAYEAEFETIQHPAITMGTGEYDEAGEEIERELAPEFEEERKTYEAAPVYFINWRDIEWSPARTWDEVRWIAFRNYLTRDQCVKRFGEKIGEAMPLGQAKKSQAKTGIEDDPWQKSECWEIWDKDTNSVFWVVEGMDAICDMKEDPLELQGFFPCPQFLLANTTSEKYAPRADYILAQDQYEELNQVSTRIRLLAHAIKCVGVYDKQSDGVQRMLNEGTDNTLIPVDNWAMFAEKGGIRGQVDWLPVEEVAKSLAILRDHRTELINLLFQVTGMSDIMRGSTQQGETATAQSIKAKFASVRVQQMQDDFAEFATDLNLLRAEVIVNHFDDESILEQSNMQQSMDAQYIPQALQMLRNLTPFKLTIKSEQLAMQDMAALRQEKTEFIQGLAGFITASVPLVQQHPAAAPVLLEMLKWTMTGFRGASTIEGVLDKAIAGLQQNPPPQPPDPNAAKEKLAQAKLQQTQMQSKQKMQEGQMKLQGDMQREAMKTRGKQAEIGANLQADLTRINAETQASVKTQAAQFAFDTRENQRQEAVRATEAVTNPRPTPQR